MPVLWEVLGSLLIAIGLTDIFLTVLHYEQPGLVAARSYRMLWRAIRTVTAPLPSRLRSLVRSMGGPVMVVATLAGWLGAQVLGFALLYLPAIGDRTYFDFGHMRRTFWSALYFSAATLTSLSFSDAEPKRLAYHWIAAMETLAGLGILTLAISYLLGLYRVLQDQSVLAALLEHQSRGATEPRTLLAPHFRQGRVQGLSGLLRELHVNLTEQHEGMRRYPIAYYFHSREASRSMPYIFWFVGAAAAALRWGLPAGHPASEEPWLPALLDGFDDIRERMTERFLSRPPTTSWSPVSREEFGAALHGGAISDERLAAFMDLQRFMSEIAEIDVPTDAEESFQRYVEWGRYTTRGKSFVDAASRDLGLEPTDLYEDPTRRRF